MNERNDNKKNENRTVLYPSQRARPQPDEEDKKDQFNIYQTGDIEIAEKHTNSNRPL